MQDVHITCTWHQLQPLVQALEEPFEAQQEEVSIGSLASQAARVVVSCSQDDYLS